jgi:hypothetical protein
MLISCLNVCNERKHSDIKLTKIIDLVFLGPIKNLLINKSANHLRLEQALKENKEVILRSLANALTITELRKQAGDLTKELGAEIQREYKEEQELCKSKRYIIFCS